MTPTIEADVHVEADGLPLHVTGEGNRLILAIDEAVEQAGLITVLRQLGQANTLLSLAGPAVRLGNIVVEVRHRGEMLLWYDGQTDTRLISRLTGLTHVHARYRALLKALITRR